MEIGVKNTTGAVDKYFTQGVQDLGPSLAVSNAHLCSVEGKGDQFWSESFGDGTLSSQLHLRTWQWFG